jgi:hypothetical protein
MAIGFGDRLFSEPFLSAFAVVVAAFSCAVIFARSGPSFSAGR